MKKTLFTAALAAAFGLVAMQASASDGQITFTGKITSANCVVTGGTGTDGQAKNIIVKLDTVSASALPAGATAGDHPFQLNLGGGSSTNCADGTQVKLNFDGVTAPSLNGVTAVMVDQATGNLKNLTGTGMATNVEVGLTDQSGAAINLYTNNNTPQATIQGGTATLNYVAHYVATGGAANPGDVKTAVMYSVVYF